MTILWSTVTISFQEREQRICVYSNNLFSPRGHRPADFNHKLVSRSASRYSWTSRNHIVDSYLFIYLLTYLFVYFIFSTFGTRNSSQAKDYLGNSVRASFCPNLLFFLTGLGGLIEEVQQSWTSGRYDTS